MGYLKLNFHLDNTENLYLTSIEKTENGYAYDSDQNRLTLPSIVRTEDKDIYTTYSIHDCAFYGMVLPDLTKVKIRQCVLNIGNYVFTKSSINTLEIFSVVPPTFASKAFEGWPQNGIKFKVVCCKGLKSIYEAVLNKFITNGQIMVEENDYVLETRNYIPYLDYAGDSLEAIEYQTELVEIKPTAYLGHRFTAFPSDSSNTKVQFLEPDDTHGAKPLEQDYYQQTTIKDYNFLESLVANRPGIIAFGAGQNNAKEMPEEIELNVLKNGLYNANYNNNYTIKFSGERLEDFGFQQDDDSNPEVKIVINFNNLKDMSQNVFRGMNVTGIQPQEAQNGVNGKCYRAINFNSVVTLTQLGMNADYIVHYDEDGTIDQIIWARQNLPLASIIKMLNYKDFAQIDSIPAYCFYQTAKEDDNAQSILTIPDNIIYIGTHAFDNYTINIVTVKNTRNKKLTIEDYAFVNSDLVTIATNKYLDYTPLVDGTNIDKAIEQVNALSYNEFEAIMTSATPSAIVTLSNSTIPTNATNNTILSFVGQNTERIVISEVTQGKLPSMPTLVFSNYTNLGITGTTASIAVESSVKNLTLCGVEVYGSITESNTTVAKNLDCYTSGLTILTEEAQTTNVKIKGSNLLMGNLGGDGIRTAGQGTVSFSGQGELICIGNAGRENDENGWTSKYITYTNPLAPQDAVSYFAGTGGSGIGYAYCGNGSAEPICQCANLTFDGLNSIQAFGYGRLAFGIGGGQYENLKHIIKNCKNIKAKGGFAFQQFLYGSQGEKNPEGGAAIGVGNKNLYNKTYSGSIEIINSTLTEIYGGSKAAGIGSCVWSGVNINIENCIFGNIYGGSHSAGIGSGLIKGDGRYYGTAPQAVKTVIKNPKMLTNKQIYGGRFGAGIGSGGTLETYQNINTDYWCNIILTADNDVDYSLSICPGVNAAGIGTGIQNAGLKGSIDANIVSILGQGSGESDYDIFGYNQPLTENGELAGWPTIYADTYDLTSGTPYLYDQNDQKIINLKYNNFTDVKIDDTTDDLYQKITIPSVQPLLRWEKDLLRTMPQRIGFGMGYVKQDGREEIICPLAAENISDFTIGNQKLKNPTVVSYQLKIIT